MQKINNFYKKNAPPYGEALVPGAGLEPALHLSETGF